MYKLFALAERLLNAEVLALCALLIFVSVCSLLDNLYLYQNASDPTLLRYKPQLAEAEADPAETGAPGAFSACPARWPG